MVHDSLVVIVFERPRMAVICDGHARFSRGIIEKRMVQRKERSKLRRWRTTDGIELELAWSVVYLIISSHLPAD